MTSPEYTDNLPPELLPTFPLCWATLTDIETEDALEELEDWITWIVARYALDHRIVPPCWEHHGALVEELSALRTAWIAAFNVAGRPRGAPGMARPVRGRSAPTQGIGIAFGVPCPAAPG